MRYRVVLLVFCVVPLGGYSVATAQSDQPSNCTVGVSHPYLADCVACLLEGDVRREILLNADDVAQWGQTGLLPSYQVVNQRSARLRDCRVYLYQSDEVLPDDAIWRERLAGHAVRVIEIPAGAVYDELETLARELCRAFPDKSDAIQRRLNEELQKRHWNTAYLRLALGHDLSRDGLDVANLSRGP
ncbi:hypothetical protein [Blastopirellula marina]|uniref:Uncharacterized protein n=1 Tax=Blastopirellula marina TaxID=124 RepID=A0A2S8FA11_9BACT|nr:hypothetical protein [Blastopirellula marina]PQO28985.1 hypothetical protein C5Y98_22500 [Blastopirellula marina]PQO43864.1 hypothetical protein C5Y93_22015 [Blastopirellula marina]PTL42257.1 hypothetical protein C5Y97_22510 [Blastopirellula marina]